MSNVSAAIFAGGKSSRFGSPKINAKLGGREFGEIIVERLRQADISEITMVGGSATDASRWKIKFIADEFNDSGPLGALLTALRNCKTEKLMILPCDVPFIDSESCKSIAQLGSEFDVRVAQTESPQWMCSTWNLRALGVIERAFSNGERMLNRVLKDLKVEFVSVESDVLRNINSAVDLEN